MAAVLLALLIFVMFGTLPLLWWLWWRVDKRLRTSERVGAARWGPFLLVVALCMLVGVPGAAVLALTPLAGVFVLAIPALTAVTLWMLFVHRRKAFALLLVLQATVAFLVAVGALFIVVVGMSHL